MSHIASPFIAVLDANVLYPFRTRDILLTFAKEGLFRARFTEDILNEWRQNLLTNRPNLVDGVNSQYAAIRNAFKECFITGHGSLIDALQLPDEDDRHVLAVAIGADDFLADTFELFPHPSANALEIVRNRYTNSAFKRKAFIMDLNKNGLPMLAARARAISTNL